MVSSVGLRTERSMQVQAQWWGHYVVFLQGKTLTLTECLDFPPRSILMGTGDKMLGVI